MGPALCFAHSLPLMAFHDAGDGNYFGVQPYVNTKYRLQLVMSLFTMFCKEGKKNVFKKVCKYRGGAAATKQTHAVRKINQTLLTLNFSSTLAVKVFQ